MEMQGRMALVTGAGSGLGRATAIRLAEEGAAVAILSRTREELEEVARQIEALGAETLIYVSTPGGAQLVARQNTRSPLHAGDRVGVSIALEQAHWFDPQGRVVNARD